MRRLHERVAALIAAVGLALRPVSAGARAAESLTVGFPSLSMSTILPHIAQDPGYFEQEGVAGAESPLLPSRCRRGPCRRSSAAFN